ncbi:MAG: phosphate-starvation-inducible PsiE family protein, partial [Deltaproteobacteria bacterium]
MKLNKILRQYETLILVLLAVMMMAVVFFATLDLAWILVKYLLTPPWGLIEINELLEVFGLFLLVLIGIELLVTIRTYRREQVIRVEIAIVVALLAISRKVIILDYKSLTSFNLFDLGVVVIALAAAYYLLRAGRESGLRDKDSVP